MKVFSKKRLLFISLAICLLCVTTVGTLAYFSAEETINNVITMGSVKIKLIEKDKDDNPFPTNGISNIVPSQNVLKKVFVKNIGSGDAYIRVKVDKRVDKDVENFDSIILKTDSLNWTYLDGYYYYNQALQANETTTVLLIDVQFCQDMGNEFAGAKIFVDVCAQAIQAKNNGQDVFTAVGWPE